MNFKDAMCKLKTGCKVTRKEWESVMHFEVVDSQVKVFRPRIVPYIYDETILISDNWIVPDKDDSCSFADMFSHLLKGYKAKLTQWDNSYIYYDADMRCLVLRTMEQSNFVLDVDSLVANDWMEV